MKKLLILSTLIFSTMMFSSTSFAEWTKVSENVEGTFYMDFERIRKVDGYVYWWGLIDRSKPNKHGIISSKLYRQGDCKLFRWKGLSWSWHKEPMGGGSGETNNDPDKEWKYPPPNSLNETTLKIVCSR